MGRAAPRAASLPPLTPGVPAPEGWRAKAAAAGGEVGDPLLSEAGDAYRHWMPVGQQPPSTRSSSVPSHPASARQSPPPAEGGRGSGGAAAVAAALAAVEVAPPAPAASPAPRGGGGGGPPSAAAAPRAAAAASGEIECQTSVTSFHKPAAPLLPEDLPPPKKAREVKPPFACYGRGNSKPTHSSDMLASYNLNPLLHPSSEKEAVLAAGGGHGHKVFKSAL